MEKSASSNNRKFNFTRFIGMLAIVLVAAVFISALPTIRAQAESNGSLTQTVWQFFGYETAATETSQIAAILPDVKMESDAPTVAPNDTFAGAITLSANMSVNGFIDSTTANDYQLATPGSPTCFSGAGQTASTAPGRDVVYSFTAPTAGAYSFRVENTGGTISSGGNLVLYLVSGTPTGTAPISIPCQATGGTPPVAIAASNRNLTTTNATEEIFNYTLTAGQQVFLVVDEGTLGTGNTFNFLVEVFNTILETEPNNTFATAQPISCGIEGSVSNTSTVQDFDYYSIGTPADGSRLFAIADGAPAGPSTDFDMRVNNATTTFEYDDLNNDVENGSSSPNIAGLPLTNANGPFAIQVDFFGSTNAVTNEPYRLAFVIQPPIASATAEAEPNDSTATATSAANNYFTGAFASATDVDVYATAANAGDLLFVGLDNNPNRNLATASIPNGNFELLDSGGNVIFTLNDFGTAATNPFTPVAGQTSTTPTSPGESTLYRIPTTGIYYVRVTTTSIPTGVTNPPYLLSISKNCATGGGGTSIAGPGTLQFSLANFTGNEGTTATITVSRSNGNTGTVTVDASVTGGTATGGASCTTGVDYINPGTQTLTFADGVNSQSFTVQLCADFVNDPGETITFGLTNATGGATIGAQNTTTLTITDVPPPPPNDTFANPEALTLNIPTVETMSNATNNYMLGTPGTPTCFTGAGQTATTAPGRDRVYSFTPTAAGSYSFRVKFANTGSDLAIYLTTDNPGATTPVTFGCQNTGGTSPVATNAANRRSATTDSGEEISCVMLTAGTTYYLVVDEVTVGSTGSGTFQLEVVSCNSETEPNNDPATANTVTSPITGTITAGDVDFFRVAGAAAGSRVFAFTEAFGSASADTALRITTSTDTLEFDDDDGDSEFGSGGFSSAIAGTLLPSSDVYMRVSGFGATTVIDPYQLTYSVRGAGTETPEVEPNDTIAQANNNSSIGYYSGVISATTDVDTYRISAEPGTLLFAALDTNPSRDNTAFDGTLRLLDASGNVVLTINGSLDATASNTGSPNTLVGTTPTSTSEALTFRIPQTLTPSAPTAPVTYFLQVTGLTGGVANDYLLSVSGIAAPTAASATISGRVSTSRGNGIRNVTVTMSGGDLAQPITTTTGANGYYQFPSVPVGGTYIIQVNARRYVFTESTRVISLTEDITGVNFIGEPVGLKGGGSIFGQ